MKKILLSVITLFFCSTAIQAQKDLSAHFGISLPTNRFADVNLANTRSGGAGIGLNIGLEYRKPLKNENLSLVFNADIIFNPLSQDFKTDYEDIISSQVDVQFYNYFNLPISGGLLYHKEISENTKIFVKAGPSLNILKMTNFVLSDNRGGELLNRYDLAAAVGLFAGVGLELNGKSIITLNLRNLGTHNIKGEAEFDSGTERLDSFKRRISLVTLTYGFKI
jgi:hypothetical protein